MHAAPQVRAAPDVRRWLEPGDVAALRRRLARAGRVMGHPPASLGAIAVALVSDAAIARLHRLHFGEPSATDVLTFPAIAPPLVLGAEADAAALADDDDLELEGAWDHGAASEDPAALEDPDGSEDAPDHPWDLGDRAHVDVAWGAGDIAISVPTAARAVTGPAYAGGARALLDELTRLGVHGLAHLLGHDHAATTPARAMLRCERRGLAAIGVPDVPRPYGQGHSPGRWRQRRVRASGGARP